MLAWMPRASDTAPISGRKTASAGIAVSDIVENAADRTRGGAIREISAKKAGARVPMLAASTVDNMLGLVTVLLLLAATIALLGITNTPALSILERRREVGLLRAVGATRGQIATMIRSEALLVAVVGGIAGIALGVIFGWAAVGALGNRYVLVLTVPAARLLAYVAIAGVAGFWPACSRHAAPRDSTCSPPSRPSSTPTPGPPRVTPRRLPVSTPHTDSREVEPS